MNLERLAELINAKWPEVRVDARGPLPWLHFTKECFCFDLTDNDFDNAGFIIWCLDRLEELGYNATLKREPHTTKLGYHYVCFWYVDDPRSTVFKEFDGETRAEACALALLYALEG